MSPSGDGQDVCYHKGAQQVIDAVQLWGGLGVVSEVPVRRLYREIRAADLKEPPRVQQLIIAWETRSASQSPG